MKVLHLVPEFRPGGGPINTLRFIRASQGQVEHYAAGGVADSALFTQYREHTKETWNIDLTRVSVRSLLRLIRILRTIKPEIVHGNGKAGSFYGTCLKLFGFRRFRFYLTLRGFKIKYSGIKKVLYTLFEKLTAAVADAVICVSPSEMDYYKQTVKPPVIKVLLIPNGISVTPADPPGDIAAELPRFSTNLVTLSRMTPQKDLVTMLESFEAVAAQHPGAALHIIGGLSHGEEEYQRTVESTHRSLECRDRVFFWGDRESAGDFLHAFDLYWSTARFEGLPTAVIEAFLNAIPVVGTACVGNVDLILDGKTGRLTALEDAQGIAEVLEEVVDRLDSAETKRMIDQARTLATEYTVQRQCDSIIKLYTQEGV